MAVIKMRQAKITCSKCDFWSLPYGIRKKLRGYETITHTFAKRIGDKPNENKKDR